MQNDTLAGNIGFLVYCEIQDALEGLDYVGELPVDFYPNESFLDKNDARQIPDGPVIIPLHYILARKGEHLPHRIEFPEYLFVISNGGNIILTYGAEQQEYVASMSKIITKGRVIGAFRIPQGSFENNLMFLTLEIENNNIWELELTSRDGVSILQETINVISDLDLS